MKRCRNLLLIVICVQLMACSTVRPWERAHHARPEMALTPDPLEATLRNHIHHSKEGSSSVSAGSGGGCGCN